MKKKKQMWDLKICLLVRSCLEIRKFQKNADSSTPISLLEKCYIIKTTKEKERKKEKRVQANEIRKQYKKKIIDTSLYEDALYKKGKVKEKRTYNERYQKKRGKDNEERKRIK